MSSWQANMVSLLLRITSKSALRVTSVDVSSKSVAALRRRTRQFNDLFSKLLPSDTRMELVRLPACKADWISVPESDPCRVILHFPGGAFCMSTPSVHRALTARLCHQARARALLVHYRLAPEDPFPAGLRDCIAAYRFLLEQGIRPQQLVIGGDSAGGALVLSTLLALRDDAAPLPAGAYLISPVADLTEHHEGSRRENRWLDPMLIPGRQKMRLMYVGGDESLLHHPYVSPVYGDFTGFPPLLFQVGDTEILRDDSVRVAEKVRAAGAPAEVEIWEGVPHVWHALPFLPEANRALSRIGEFVRGCTPAIDLGRPPTTNTALNP
jgi:acetyl esterase/lipase